MTFIVLYSLNVSLVPLLASLHHFALLQGLMGLTVNHLVMPRREKVCGFYLIALYSLDVSLVLFLASLHHFALLQGLMGLTVNHLVMPRRERVCGFLSGGTQYM